MSKRGEYLAIGGGVTLETATFSLAVPDASPALGAVVAVIAIACATPMARAFKRRNPAEEPSNLAVECRRVQRALEDFVEARRRVAPSQRPLLRALQFWRPSQAAWARETEHRYQRDLKDWTTRVYDRLERDSVVTSGSRPSVERPSAAQIEHLADLFANAARSLE